MSRPLGWLDPWLLGRPHIGVLSPELAPKNARKVALGHVPQPLQQGAVGSCGLQCAAAGVLTLQGINGFALAMPDRPKAYYRARRMLGSSYVHQDSGCVLADVASVLSIGFEVEERHAYTWGPLWTTEPGPAPEGRRLHGHEALSVSDGDLFDNLYWEIANGSVPVLGLRLTDQWNHAEGVPVLDNPDGESIGGHGIMVCEADPDARMVRILNSWGPEFGDGGRIWLGEEWLQRPWCGEAISLRAYYHRSERPAQSIGTT
jgi:hypothetical protein